MSVDQPEVSEERVDLVAHFAAMSADDPQRAEVRDALAVMHQPLVKSLARRFAGRGEPMDDLIQAGNEGLIKALNRFDPAASETGTLSTYVVPTVLGEIRRHFRDRTWAVHVPRRLQDLSRQVESARDTLGQELRRSPTVVELADHLGVEPDEVLEAMEAGAAYATNQLDGTDSTVDPTGTDDDALLQVLHRESLRPQIAALEPRDRRILTLRFVDERSQEEIAEDVGLSQAQVSRRLTQTLAQLRRAIDVDSDG